MLAVSYFPFKNDTRLPSKLKTKNQDCVILSIWEDITFGVPQGSILRPLLINVFIYDIFLEYGNNYFANYADNMKIRIVDENTKEVLKICLLWLTAICAWLANNQTKANHKKCHLLLSTQRSTCIQIKCITVKYWKAETLKEININNKIKFDIHVVFAGGREMKIFTTVFRDLGKYILGKWYFQN